MSGREIDNVLFLGNTKIFEGKVYLAFLLLPRPSDMQKKGKFDFSSLTELFLIFVQIWVYLGVRTYELFLCFVVIVGVRDYYVDFFVFFVLRHW